MGYQEVGHPSDHPLVGYCRLGVHPTTHLVGHCRLGSIRPPSWSDTAGAGHTTLGGGGVKLYPDLWEPLGINRLFICQTPSCLCPFASGNCGYFPSVVPVTMYEDFR